MQITISCLWIVLYVIYGDFDCFKSSSDSCLYIIKNNGQPIFINIGKSCPIALYGGNTKCAAVTNEGSVLILSNSALRTPEKEIQAVSLLNNEKAVIIACCDHVIYTLSTVGHVYKSTLIDSFSSFKIISELCETEIIWISGTCHRCLAVSKEGRFYACGSNGYGEISLKNDNEEILC
ncbi:hypothetical protein M9Y10_006063 [Tritrichomonas musculus]|uniref:Regulator of chromosome condensation n=1 Tax=Tritrichomonas musculus TaxID=1915356 RepID=A0ABR2JFH1_9EUKA